MGLSLRVELQIVGTGVPDGPPPAHRSSLSGLCYSRTVEDAGPYEFNLFVGFKQFAKLQFVNTIKNAKRKETPKSSFPLLAIYDLTLDGRVTTPSGIPLR